MYVIIKVDVFIPSLARLLSLHWYIGYEMLNILWKKTTVINMKCSFFDRIHTHRYTQSHDFLIYRDHSQQKRFYTKNVFHFLQKKNQQENFTRILDEIALFWNKKKKKKIEKNGRIKAFVVYTINVMSYMKFLDCKHDLLSDFSTLIFYFFFLIYFLFILLKKKNQNGKQKMLNR